MPGKGRGGRRPRKGKGRAHNAASASTELTLKEDCQEYAQVTRMLGDCHVEAACFDGKTRLCRIRGKMKKRTWITAGDIVLIGLRDFQDERGDVLLKYSSDEARRLKSMGELPETHIVTGTAGMGGGGTGRTGGMDDAKLDELAFDFDQI